MNFKQKLLSLAGLGLLCAILIVLVAIYTKNTMDKASRYQMTINSALKNHLDGDMMHDAIRGDVLNALLSVSKNDLSAISDIKKDLAEHADRFRNNITANQKLDLDTELKSLLREQQPTLESYIDAAETILVMAQREPEKIDQLMLEFNDAFDELEEVGEKLSNQIQQYAQDADKRSTQVSKTGKIYIYVILLVSAVLLVVYSSYMIRNTLGMLGDDPAVLKSAVDSIASGEFTFSGKDYDKTSVMGAMMHMCGNIKGNQQQATANSRIRSALDVTSCNVMIADTNRTIIYMNKSVEKMLRNVEIELRKALPHFAVDKIVGSNIDIFHKNPAHQSHLLSNLRDTYIGNIQVAGLSFRLIANPIFDEKGERLGSVVEWLDRTAEVKAESEIATLVEAAAAGDLQARVETQGKQGFFLKLAEGLNQLVGTAEKGLNDVARVLGAMAKGDLTAKIDAEYSGTFGDLKNYCNDTNENLISMLLDIRNAAETIFTASSEIAQGNADLSSRTEQQAANLEETASSMEELTSTVKLNADNAKQANVLAEQASSVATDGGVLIQKVVVTMDDINQSAKKISDIIGVIDGIAFQTNILALNAAVEAARAGDQGRGFAVVASEVRTLAQRSANAAKDIKALISDSVQKIESGNSLVNKSGETMKEIVNSIKRVNDIMSEIAAASNEQSTGIEEVSTAVSQMDEMTQQNAALVEEAAAAAESLQSQADQLNRSVGQFRLSIESNVTSAPRLAAPRASQSRASTPSAPKKLTPPKSNADDEWESF
jgi:methyl-accepting chemotaxis protein